MIHSVLVWVLVAAFAGAGLANASGIAGTRENLVRWGYSDWWCRLTGGLELATAALIALPAPRVPGMILGTAIIVAAIVTVLRHREPRHLLPLGVFAILLLSCNIFS